jgi:hypothetical protein
MSIKILNPKWWDKEKHKFSVIQLHNRTHEDGHLWPKHVEFIFNKCCIIDGNQIVCKILWTYMIPSFWGRNDLHFGLCSQTPCSLKDGYSGSEEHETIVFTFTLMMVANGSSEMSVTFCLIRRRHNSHDQNINYWNWVTSASALANPRMEYNACASNSWADVDGTDFLRGIWKNICV